MKRLGIKALGRKVFGNSEGFEIREQAVSSGANFGPENGSLSPKTPILGKKDYECQVHSQVRPAPEPRRAPESRKMRI
ncbi:MAG: hypothetical protein JW786_08620 [Desulfobacterales bacterium]|nr:hypothetical protein [Desulfobacterales bacterium]